MTTSDDFLQVLVAEDDASSRDLISSIFEIEEWSPPVHAHDGGQALDILKTRNFDILISDLNMPKVSGEELVPRALEVNPEMTAVVITGNGTIECAVRLMKYGLFDFITKPFTIDRFVASLEKARERATRQKELHGISEVVDALLLAVESKDRHLNGHSGRVCRYAVELGRRIGVRSRELQLLGYAAKLHDVGKIGIHEDVLKKDGPLTAEEFEIMKRHPAMSRDILAPVTFLAPCLDTVYHHHERIDGRGYPDGIAGNAIPLGARIISVVDSFDAMNSDRAYRSALPLERILTILDEVAGTQLDPDLVEVFLRDFHEIVGPLENNRDLVQV